MSRIDDYRLQFRHCRGLEVGKRAASAFGAGLGKVFGRREREE
jgi:hypothetical protein